MTSKPEINPATPWLTRISEYDREFKKWTGKAEKILKRYRDDSRDGRSGYSEAKFNILWSNVQTLVPATFARLPKPDVQRRFGDNDPVGRVASMILERALDYEIQHYDDYRTTLRECIFDRFLGGRGTAWVRYEPHMRAIATGAPEDGEGVTEDTDEPQEELDYECAPTDYVHWKDFGHTVARTWEEVTAVWRHVYMTREALVERFGDEGEKVPLDTADDRDNRKSAPDVEKNRGHIIEIWDKTTKRALWIANSLGKIIDEQDDPLGLEEFFPCPRPLYASLTTDSLVPVPDFLIYQDQANTLDLLCDRIDGLCKQLQIRGIYDASQVELGRLFTEAENGTLIPAKNWAAFAEKSGLKGSLDLVDITPIANALNEAFRAFEQQKQQVYELTGISDIVRGQTAASETATAQAIKGQYASLRLKSYQEEVAAFATTLLRLKAQLICGKFDPMTVFQMAAADQLTPQDQQFLPEAAKLLFGERLNNPESDAPNPLRCFRIEVAADSMVQMQEQEEKEARSEFLTAVGGFIKNFAPLMQTMPQLAPMLLEMLKFTAGAYKAGKSLEGIINQVAQQWQQQGPPPNADQMREQITQQVQQQMAAQHAQKEMALNSRAADLDIREMKFGAEQQVGQVKAQASQMEQEAALQRFYDDAVNRIRDQAQATSTEMQRLVADLERGKAEAREAAGAESAGAERAERDAAIAQAQELQRGMQEQIAQVLTVLAAPKRLVRDPQTGKAVGVEPVL